MTRRGWLLMTSSGLFAAGAAVVGVAAARHLYRPATRDITAESQLLDLINSERARTKYKTSRESKEEPRQVPPLVEDEALRQVALAQAKNMGRNQSKIAPGQEQLKQEVAAAGYPFQWLVAVTDLAYSIDLSEAFARWMDEPKHKQTKQLLLDPVFSDIGVGVYRDGTADAYYLIILLAKKK